MEQCKECVEIREGKEPSDNAFVVHCIDGKGHEANHQAHVWILAENKATGTKGYFTTIKW